MPNILIVEDEAHLADGLTFNLEREGHEITVARDGTSADRFLTDSSLSFDLVLLDLMMPALNGERILELLHGAAATRKVAVVLHSSKSGEELSQVVSETGAAGAITKTSSDTDFIHQFDRIVAAVGLSK